MLAVYKTLSSVLKWRSKPNTEQQDVLENKNPKNKSGRLLCKKVEDENGTKTKKSQRAWKPFYATIQDMVLCLQAYSNSSAKKDRITISLLHALAYPIKYNKRPHVLCLRTANLQLFYLQAECEADQTSWVANLNRTTACYSVPPLLTVSHNRNEGAQFLPTFCSHLSHEQQLRCCKDHLQMLSEHLQYYLTLPFRSEVLAVGYLLQQVKNYTTYVEVLQELVEAENAGEGCSNSALSNITDI
ncbi:PH and SEC7 domain-containing protein 3 [Silurus meridionalis]|nr:PH and SEC7 domain-containing protein 3 [Silurus meridionalis]